MLHKNNDNLTVPSDQNLRNAISAAAAKYVTDHNLTGPIPRQDLLKFASEVTKLAHADDSSTPYTAVMLNNELWRPAVEQTEYARRLLLLPKCLRDHENCPADIDEIGLTCKSCGRCPIQKLKSLAENLGYATLVAEGSPIVMSLIQSGKIEALIGVSCLNVLENVFPFIEAGAIPAIAIPLLNNGCIDTTLDEEMLINAINAKSDLPSNSLKLEKLRSDVQNFFTPQIIDDVLNTKNDQTAKIGADWITTAGKRWRPLLTAGTYRALTGSDQLPETLRNAAIAVECFHKASLIHDDIEDADTTRYDQPTIAARHGIPIAINVGDFLIGEGYRILSELNIPADKKVDILKTAAQGHRHLCQGQGKELLAADTPTTADILEIFAGKTAPAFQVALTIGATLASADQKTIDTLSEYSNAIGIAYQIRDDIADSTGPQNDLDANRPSIITALANENSTDKQSATQNACDLLETQKQAALAALAKIDNTPLKTLLARVLYKIFNNEKLTGCCDDNT